MAVVSTLFGGVGGFFGFVVALIVFNTGFFAALGLYFGLSFLLAGLMLVVITTARQVAALIPFGDHTARRKAAG